MVLVLLIGLVLLSVAVAAALRAVTIGSGRREDVLAGVAAYGFGGDQSEGRRHVSLSEAVAELALRVGNRLEQRLGEGRGREVRVMLNSAGYYRTSVARYLGYRVVAAAGAPFVLLVLTLLGSNAGAVTLLGAAAFAGLGWMLPPFVVRQRSAQRIARIDYEVPELVDLLVTTVEAGVGFAAALQMCARRVHGPLGEELRLTLREQSMGLTTDDALQNLLERAGGSVAMRAFVQALVQGEKLGVSIGKVLRDLAVDMRKRRRQVAEERAQKAPVKLLFPLVFLILPALLMVVIGPAAYAVLHSLHA